MKFSGSARAAVCLAAIAGAVVTGAGVATATTPVEPSGDAIVIGASLELSGPLAVLGNDTLLALELAVDELNASGGVLGRPVELETRDNESAPDKAVQEATELVEDGVDVLFNAISSGAGLAISTTVSGQQDVLLMNTSASTNRLTVEEFQPNLFSLAPNSIMESRAHAIYLAEAGFTRIALLGADYEAGHANLAVFRSYIEENYPDIEIVEELFHPTTEVDFSSYISRLSAAEPDAIYYPFVGDALINFTQQARQVGLFDDATVMSFYDSTVLEALGDQAPVGALGTGRAPFFALETEAGTAFVEAFHSDAGVYPSDSSAMAYSGVHVWADAVEIAGSTDREAVAAALESNQFEMLTDTVTFRALDHQADVPIFVGTVTEVDPDYGFAIWSDVSRIDGDRTIPSEAEVEQRRADA